MPAKAITAHSAGSAQSGRNPSASAGTAQAAASSRLPECAEPEAERDTGQRHGDERDRAAGRAGADVRQRLGQGLEHLEGRDDREQQVDAGRSDRPDPAYAASAPDALGDEHEHHRLRCPRAHERGAARQKAGGDRRAGEREPEQEIGQVGVGAANRKRDECDQPPGDGQAGERDAAQRVPVQLAEATEEEARAERDGEHARRRERAEHAQAVPVGRQELEQEREADEQHRHDRRRDHRAAESRVLPAEADECERLGEADGPRGRRQVSPAEAGVERQRGGDHDRAEEDAGGGHVQADEERGEHRRRDAEERQRLSLDPDGDRDRCRGDDGGERGRGRGADQVVDRRRRIEACVEAGDADSRGGEDRVGAPLAAVELDRGAEQAERDEHAEADAHRGSDPAAAGGHHKEQDDAERRRNAAGPRERSCGEELFGELAPVHRRPRRPRRGRRHNRSRCLGLRRRCRRSRGLGAGLAGGYPYAHGSVRFGFGAAAGGSGARSDTARSRLSTRSVRSLTVRRRSAISWEGSLFMCLSP